ncbi:hypothetical protein BTHERMOSOX_576 [Bathymodiolus thermophilus thioautotrophic gill symbiont]|nr:hypothetical protein BTHERMOSOX_576 [Bathymodiolus thermophilus thioautotrophic gill symbiont]
MTASNKVFKKPKKMFLNFIYTSKKLQYDLGGSVFSFKK